MLGSVSMGLGVMQLVISSGGNGIQKELDDIVR